MSPAPVIVRYWAGARAAAGVASEELDVTGPTRLDEVVSRILAAHGDGHLDQVISVCSVLVGDAPVGTRSHCEIEIAPGSTVEFLPPFAGG